MSYKFDPYLILGVAPSINADALGDVYEALVAHLENSKSPNAAKQLEMVRDAYELLTSPLKRQEYLEYREKLDEEVERNHRFSFRITPSKRVVKPIEEEQVIYALAELVAPQGVEVKMDERSVRLNLTLVIDQSRSMDDGGRMRRVIAAAQTAITELSRDDVVSIISFNDRATVVVPATPVTDVMTLRARVSMIQAKGGTEIYKGLLAGVKENRKHLSPQMVNHVLLLTDGRTFGDEDQCLELAKQAAAEGISISAMGLGTDWNDDFLDKLATFTGGASTYVKTVNMVSEFIQQQLRSLSSAFAERMQLSVVLNPAISIEMAFKISPHPQPLVVEDGVITLAGLQAKRPIGVLLQLQLPAKLEGDFINIGRFLASGDIMLNDAQTFYTASDLSLEVSEDPGEDSPPASIVDALSKLTLYRLQEKAHEAMERGDIEEATRHLQYLATRLIDMGENELGQRAMAEAQHVLQTRAFSNEETKKTIKYQTRALIEPGGMKRAITTLFEDDD